MRYTVVWDEDVLQKLAQIYLEASNRSVITAATNRADLELSFSPETKGKDFYGDRLLVVPPLHVVFNASPDDFLVTIVDIWSV